MGQDRREVLCAVADRVATITLNRPERLNAWTPVMASELREAMLQADADATVRAIVLTGAGRGFCAGADMAGLSGAAAGRGSLRIPETPSTGLEANFAQRCSYLLAIKKPILAAINGPVAGIGLVIALYCDIRYMAAGAKLTTAFARRGSALRARTRRARRRRRRASPTGSAKPIEGISTPTKVSLRLSQQLFD